MIRIQVFRFCGHEDTGPIGLLAQSIFAISEPSSPPPEKRLSGPESGECAGEGETDISGVRLRDGCRLAVDFL